jgi:TRAP-type C4-dicarboxylate transport system permease small subunit
MKKIAWILLCISIIVLFIVICWTSYNVGKETGRIEGATEGINYVGYNLCSLNKTFDCGTKVCGCFQITNNPIQNKTNGV